MDYEILNSQVLAHGKIMDFYQDTLEMPDGNPAVREYFTKSNATAIVPLTREGKVVLVRQYRHPLRKDVLEIPAGVIEEGEEPLACAKRELEEETGQKCQELTPLCVMHTSVGVSTEAIYIYLAKDLQPGTQHLDADEFLTVEECPLEEAIGMIFSGKITDSKTISGLLACREYLQHNPMH